MEDRLKFDAAVVDMDGVITRTALVHAKAWKKMFDDFLKHLDSSQPEFDKINDYKIFVDGKPRFDGIRSFLSSRNITLPEGSPGDDKSENTVQGLGKRKNEIFLQTINEDGVNIYEDTAELLKHWKKAGIKLAMITSSRNGKMIIEKSGMRELFESMIDGIRSAELKINGKPAPDIFLKAAEELSVEAGRTIILEDSIAGVQAGKTGRFGLVIGVARDGDDKELLDAGADIVSNNLIELKDVIMNTSKNNTNGLPHAIDNIDDIKKKAGGKEPVLFLDYDGTLTPIVNDPDKALLSEKAKDLLVKLAEKYKVTLVSGRDRADVKSKVKIENVYYAGSHGFDITGPGNLELQYEGGKKALPELNTAGENLKKKLSGIKGAQVEKKKYAIAVHYRNVDEKNVQEVKNAVYEELGQRKGLKEGSGKKVIELKPDIDWHKGRAIEWLKEALDINDEKYITIFIGDDVTDEDGFTVIKGKGIGILVGSHGSTTDASYSLKNTDEVLVFLEGLLN